MFKYYYKRLAEVNNIFMNKYVKLCNMGIRAYVQKVKSAIREFKEASPCTDCKIFYPYYVMQYDHITDDKIANIKEIRSLPKVLREIEKCELVCANCHATRTHTRRLDQIKNVI